VIREAGGDRSAVTGGTRVLSDQIKIRITSNPGETFIDRMIALVEGAERQKTPNEIALNILLAGLTIIFLLAVVTLQPFAIYSSAPQTIFGLVSLLVCLIPTTIGGLLSAIGIAGMDRQAERLRQRVMSIHCCSTKPGPLRLETDKRPSSFPCQEWKSRSLLMPPNFRRSRMKRRKADRSLYWRRKGTDCEGASWQSMKLHSFPLPHRRECQALMSMAARSAKAPSMQ
jgi:hypothetical protein